MCTNECEKTLEIMSMIDDFKRRVIYEDRYFIKHELLDIISLYSTENTRLLPRNKIIYRARTFDDGLNHSIDEISNKLIDDNDKRSIFEMKENRKFTGYSKNGCGVPPNSDMVNDGRATPQYVKCLYAAFDPYTAMIEIRPSLQSKVSIAQIQTKREFRIMDFTVFTSLTNRKNHSIDNAGLLMAMSKEYSTLNNSGELKEYLFTQVISNYVRSIGFDGIVYNSSLNHYGVNIVIFDYAECEPVGSVLYQVNGIKYTATCIKPDYYRDLEHGEHLFNFAHDFFPDV